MNLPQLSLHALFWLVAVIHCSTAEAELWTEQMLFDKADVVAVVTASDAKETENTDGLFPDHLQQLESKLDLLAVLKGKVERKPLTLVHFRYRKDIESTLGNGPTFVVMGTKEISEHDLRRKPRYLVFLRRRADGRYDPVTGNEEDAADSVIRLLVFPEFDPASQPVDKKRPTKAEGTPKKKSEP